MSITSARDLIDGNLHLRRPVEADVEARLKLGNHAEIHEMFGGDVANMRPITREQAEAWVANQMAEPLAWVIAIDGRMVGGIRLHSLSMLDYRATLAVGLLDPGMLGQGVGSRAIRLVLGFAFGPLGLHRVSLRVLDVNERAIAAYEKVGFRVEGRERESARLRDTWHDDLITGVLAHEFAELNGDDGA